MTRAKIVLAFGAGALFCRTGGAILHHGSSIFSLTILPCLFPSNRPAITGWFGVHFRRHHRYSVVLIGRLKFAPYRRLSPAGICAALLSS